MKVFLTMIMCSIVNGQTTCIDPYTFPESYEDSYSCLIQGYQKSIDKVEEIGREAINEHGIYIKFGCNEIIIPPTEPKVNT
jgi:hypothetical protein|nr:hypothetical protein [uncultured Mediterranean phage uvMED]|tara:strand:- start:329 stop:571 length:243 start_codon:yes stop_codon:yes gene_type:complete